MRQTLTVLLGIAKLGAVLVRNAGLGERVAEAPLAETPLPGERVEADVDECGDAVCNEGVNEGV
jgi:hypothetical protein